MSAYIIISHDCHRWLHNEFSDGELQRNTGNYENAMKKKSELNCSDFFVGGIVNF